MSKKGKFDVNKWKIGKKQQQSRKYQLKRTENIEFRDLKATTKRKI